MARFISNVCEVDHAPSYKDGLTYGINAVYFGDCLVLFISALCSSFRQVLRTEVISYRYDHTTYFKGSIALDFYVGGTLISPTSHIKNTLDQKGYGDIRSSSSFFNIFGFGSPIDYPQVSNLPVFGISLQYAHRTHSELGLALTTRTANIKGYGYNKGYLVVGYNTYQFTPFYRWYSTYHRSYVEAGMPLSIFQLHEGERTKQRNLPAVFKPGLKLGGGVYTSNKTVADLQFKMNFYLSFPGIKVDALQQRTEGDSFQVFTLFDKPIPFYALEFGIVYGSRFHSRKAK
jgi:hypothetical protein